MADPMKVLFRLVADEDGYPPVAVESLWAIPSKTQGQCVLSNIPFFTTDATLGDTIAVRYEESAFWFDQVVTPSRNSLIRVIFHDHQCIGSVIKRLEELGCDVELAENYSLLAVSIPPRAKLAAIQTYLEEKENECMIGYEEPILWDSE